MPENPKTAPHTVGLFATCLVDLMRPSIGFAAVRLLERAGCLVSVPTAQTCCGQPAYNAGDRADARKVAAQVIEAFEKFDYVVAPSGSCAGMIRVHYPGLFDDGEEMKARARALAARTYELTSFLNDILQVTELDAEFSATATYHDSCAGLRELGIKDQPRSLLALVRGLKLIEGETPENCCGFGGLFSIKYPDISAHIADARADDALAAGADLLLGGDLGCLMNLAGRMSRRGTPLAARHVAEVLAGMTDIPPILGDDEESGGEG